MIERGRLRSSVSAHGVAERMRTDQCGGVDQIPRAADHGQRRQQAETQAFTACDIQRADQDGARAPGNAREQRGCRGDKTDQMVASGVVGPDDTIGVIQCVEGAGQMCLVEIGAIPQAKNDPIGATAQGADRCHGQTGSEAAAALRLVFEIIAEPVPELADRRAFTSHKDQPVVFAFAPRAGHLSRMLAQGTMQTRGAAAAECGDKAGFALSDQGVACHQDHVIGHGVLPVAVRRRPCLSARIKVTQTIPDRNPETPAFAAGNAGR
jgi:hypothetical protein